MRVICVGDVVGPAGCEFLRDTLPKLKRYYQADYSVVNGENSDVTNGVTPKSAEHLFVSGADVITTGNHVFQRREVYPYLEENEYILRPINYPPTAPGRGCCLLEGNRGRLMIVNLMGNIFMEQSLENPFLCMDRFLSEQSVRCIIVDFHAEATSEKTALAHYLDGRVSAVLGTHTHVQTADERILPGGTAFMCDMGMTGVKESSLGIKMEPVIQRFCTQMPSYMEAAEGPCFFSGIFLEIDEKSGKCVSLERIQAT